MLISTVYEHGYGKALVKAGLGKRLPGPLGGTPLPSEQTMAQTKLVDEARTKAIIRKKRSKAVSRPTSHMNLIHIA